MDTHKKITLVHFEDERAESVLFQHELKDAGISVDSYVWIEGADVQGNLKQLEDIIADNHGEIILVLDNNMPSLNGPQVVKFATEKGLSPKRIAMRSNSALDPESAGVVIRTELEKLGVKNFFGKNNNPELLITWLRGQVASLSSHLIEN